MDLQSKSMDWFLYDKDLRHERVNSSQPPSFKYYYQKACIQKTFKLFKTIYCKLVLWQILKN